MKIYTKKGDKGTTSFASGRVVSKDDHQIEAYGTIDELNSFVGWLRSQTNHPETDMELKTVQNCLFNIGALLAKDGLDMKKYPQLLSDDIRFLENSIDKKSAVLDRLRNFILPAGSERIALCHVCRTVSRRAERRIVSLETQLEEKMLIVAYINRLSDYFFTLARFFAYLEEKAEIAWDPNFRNSESDE